MRSQVPKVLHRVCGRAVISLVVDAAKLGGFDTTVAVVAPDSHAVRDSLGDGIAYAVQREPKGTGDALLQARRHVETVNNVAVMYGDVPLVRPETLDSMMQQHVQSGAFVTLLTAHSSNPDGLGRVVRNPSGAITAVVEERDANDDIRSITEVNGGVYCFRSSWLWPNLEALAPAPSGEIYLTDLVERAVQQGLTVESVRAQSPLEITGVNTRVQLAQVEAALRQSLRERWMLAGVTMPDPSSVFIDVDAALGEDTVVLPNTHITGASRIGRQCEIGPNSIVDDSEIGDGCRIVASVVRDSTLEDGVDVGPFSHIRSASHLERGVHIGTSAEVKQSRLGPDTRSGHFSYIGDAEVGANVNIGAGTVTCNYDGTEKHRTRIDDDAFIGSDTMLIAPVTIGARSSTGAGSVVNKDVPPDSQAVGVPATVRPKWNSSPGRG